jgi:hypothetical protein
MFIQVIIASLLIVNACFYVNRLWHTQRYRISRGELTILKAKGIAYLLLNIICICLIFMIN